MRPLPVRELPVRPERMIHFFPPHLEKIRTRVPDMVREVDVLLGNLEDAIPADAEEAARAGSIEVAGRPIGDTALWTRVNALEQPVGPRRHPQDRPARSWTSST